MTTPTVPIHPAAGAAVPVHAVTGPSIGGPAIPVYVVSDGRPTLGQPPRRVKLITDADLTINGGNYWIEGRPFAMPIAVSTATSGDEGNVAIPVYAVNAWPGSTPAWLYTLDQFTGADTTLITARAMDTGESWTARQNNYEIAGNWARSNVTDNTYSIDTVTLPLADVTVEVSINFKFADIPTHIVGRYTDLDNYWMVSLKAAAGNGFRIIERNAGVETVRAFANPTISDTGTYTVRATFSGSTITATVDGGSTITYASATLNQTAKAFGIMAQGNNPPATYDESFDYFLAWPGSGSPPTNPIYPFSLSAPVSYRVIQRSGTTAGILVTGTIAAGSGTHDIEASFNGGAYATIASAVTGAFSGTRAGQTNGQGTLRVRFVDDTGRYEDKAYIGIGDVFVIAGQSNASGGMTNPQSYTHAVILIVF